MKRTLVYLVFLLAISSTVNAVVIDPSDSNIMYTGRWNFSNPSVPWVYWQGSSIIVNFKGTGISIDIDSGSSTGQYREVIDGVVETSRRRFLCSG